MTNEEAIKTLRELWRNTNDPWYEKVYEMAIAALTAQESSNQLATNLQPCKQDDLIERARAIEIIHELQDSQTFGQTADNAYDLVDWAISEIPSAQPEIIRCKECKHWREGTVYSYCDKLYGMGVLDIYDYMTTEDDYCSMAERITNV